MLRDVFYFGEKPNVHPRERYATDLSDAKRQCTTEHFWVINEHCNYKDFDWDWDFDFLPDEDVWAEEHNNVWPSPYQKDSGTCLCSTDIDAVTIYRADVEPIPLKEEITSNWKIIEYIEKDKFDFKWHPDPSDPPYIYVWGNKWYPGTIMPTVEYHVPGATDRKYILDHLAPLLQMPRLFNIIYEPANFDYTWRPDPTAPPYIYVFGNNQYPASIMPTVEFHVEGATERKFIENIVPKLAARPADFEALEDIDPASFDMTWVPDPTAPPYIYAWGNQWNKPEDKISVIRKVEGATEYKYMEARVKRNPCMNNWIIPSNMFQNKFDFSWEPNPHDPLFIYQFGTQWQKTGGPRYIVDGATEIKYIDTLKAEVVCTEFENWQVPKNVDQSKFDFSWHPDSTEEPFIYQFADQWTRTGGPRYITPGATEIKYIDAQIATAMPDKKHWTIPEGIDTTDFDFSWHPDIDHAPLIYQFGTQWQRTGGPRFYSVGCTEDSDIQYIDTLKAKALVTSDNWITREDVIDFNYSWHPDSTEQPYIYQWGNKFYGSELKPTVEYVVPGATEIKHMTQDVKLTPTNNWTEYCAIDKNQFDMSWRPDPTSPPYIYVWGNKHVDGTTAPTIEYSVEGATEYKFVSNDVEVLPELDKWKIIEDIDFKKFDFTWRPNPKSPPYIYVWGNKHVRAEMASTIEYHVPGATEYSYIDDPIEVMPQMDRWVMYQEIDKTEFDLSWRPDPNSPAYIYVWGNKYIAGELRPTIEYHMPGATEKKYMEEPAKVVPIIENWKILQEVDTSKFDLAWRPDPREPDYIYVWGNKYIPAELQSTLEYHVPGATEIKYMGDVIVEPEWDKWNIIIPVDKSSFDFRWRPDPREPAFIYIWGNKYNESEREPSVEYRCAGATEIKYMDDRVATTLPDMTKWTTLIPIENFDYSWRPDPKSPPYIYVFGNKWNDSTTEPTLEYKVATATEIKYINDIVATPKPELQYWKISNNDDLETFDFSWRPNPHSPPQIYQWADNGPRYTMADATEVVFMERTEETVRHIVKRYKIKTTLEALITEHPDEVFWAINPDLTYDKFDFGWRPNEENFRHVNVFGNEYSMNTQTYYVNAPLYMMGQREFNYVEGQTVEIDSNLSMFYIDRGNSESITRFNVLKIRYPQIQKTRYLNSWVDTINRCVNKSQTKLCWVLNSEIDYNEFEFDFYPSPWQEKMVHVFGTQWSHWGTTFMVNKESFTEDTKYVKIIEHLNVLNFVKSKRTIARNCLYPIYLVDHGNETVDEIKGLPVTKVKYEVSYLRTFKKLLATLPEKNEHYIWVCSSICDYENFDFSYICDPYAKDQLHVFPSDKQKFGDTFLIDVNKFKSLIDDMIMMEDYEKVNYNQHQRVKRLPAPIIITKEDTHVTDIHTDFDWPYATFVTEDNKGLDVLDSEPISLWTPDTKNILITSTGATRIIVPKEAKDYIENELYDYPYISRSKSLAKSHPLDIVFLSNGETGADKNYEHLLKVSKGLNNRVVRVDGVNGRVQAYHAAAEASNTPWMFTVFAKLKVNDKFDWSWQPDRLQVPKHYIFHATNPVNGLEYGHQAMIAYNKKITLANTGTGLDFTLDNEHEVVELNSGVAMYNTDEFSTWRTSFREAIKLRADESQASKDRLEAWLTIGEGDYAQYSINGATDAVEYYEQVNGELDKLRLSYDWPWLKKYFNTKYN